MASGSASNPDRSMGDYWLTMSDASSFTVVESCVLIAADLRRDLAERVRVVSTHHPVDIAEMLMSAADLGWGKGKASQLVAQFANLSKCDPLRKATAYKLVREAFAKLPLTLWTQEKLPARGDLLEDMASNAIGAQAVIPQTQTEEQKREQALRASIAAACKAEMKQRTG
jgi:hypothetical protein